MKKLYNYFVELVKTSAEVILEIVLSDNFKKRLFVFLTGSFVLLITLWLFNHCYHGNMSLLHDLFHIDLHNVDFSRITESTMVMVESNGMKVNSRFGKFIIKHFKKISIYNLYLFIGLNLYGLFVMEFTTIGFLLHILQIGFQVYIEVFFHHLSHDCKSKMERLYDYLNVFFNNLNYSPWKQ